MATFVEGIAASENIDSSGERLSIRGMDISSLATTGTFTWEHKKDVPTQVIGKILKAKKIFSEDDCEDDRELYFYKKCGVPYVYVMGELFDEFCDSSKHIAGLLKYDHSKQGENDHDVIGFSVEGSKIEKQGSEVTRSIARIVTLTLSPCNKAAIAELVAPEKSEDSADDIFKTEPTVEIKLFKSSDISFAKDERDLEKHASILGLPPMNKSIMNKPGALIPPHPSASAPAALPARTNNPGIHIGSTSSGKKVFSHARTHEYSNFSSSDHQEAANLHYNAAKTAKEPSLGAHHFNQTKMHMQAAGKKERQENRFSAGRQSVAKMPLAKALEAGSGLAAPGSMNQGAALQAESLEGKKETLPSAKKKKKKWFDRATEEYENWGKREEFRSFMSEKMPHLTMSEIDAIGKTLALKKSVEAEESLSNMMGLAKSAPQHSSDGETNTFSKLPKDHVGPVHTVSWNHPKTGSTNKYHFADLGSAHAHAKSLSANGIKNAKVSSSG